MRSADRQAGLTLARGEVLHLLGLLGDLLPLAREGETRARVEAWQGALVGALGEGW